MAITNNIGVRVNGGAAAYVRFQDEGKPAGNKPSPAVPEGGDSVSLSPDALARYGGKAGTTLNGFLASGRGHADALTTLLGTLDSAPERGAAQTGIAKNPALSQGASARARAEELDRMLSDTASLAGPRSPEKLSDASSPTQSPFPPVAAPENPKTAAFPTMAEAVRGNVQETGGKNPMASGPLGSADNEAPGAATRTRMAASAYSDGAATARNEETRKADEEKALQRKKALEEALALRSQGVGETFDLRA